MDLDAWDERSQDARDWALALAAKDSKRCPRCGGDDPEQLCQNPATQHAWKVDITRCYRSRAEQMAMERFKNDPYFSTFIPHTTLDLSRVKT